MSDVIKSRGQRNPTRYDPKSYTLVHESDKFTSRWIIICEIIIVLGVEGLNINWINIKEYYDIIQEGLV